MKSIRKIALGVILAIGAFSAVMYSSCSKSSTDKCASVTCQNGGSCASGVCTCKTGFGGAVCDTQIRNVYANTYKGNGQDGTGTTITGFKTVFINPADTAYTGMKLTAYWPDGTTAFSASVVLSNMSISGTANYTITTYTDTANNTFSGSGTISAGSASLTFTQKDNTGGSSETYTFASGSLVKQ